jgi:hypothetical protein
MKPNDLPPCTFKEDIIRMAEAFRLNANDSVFEASTDPTELEQGEEFILIKVSKGKRKCWATFLGPNAPEVWLPSSIRNPDEKMFPVGTTVEQMLGHWEDDKERRAEAEKMRKADNFFDLWASTGEKDSTGLRRAFKSRPGSPKSNKDTGKTPAEPKDE